MKYSVVVLSLVAAALSSAVPREAPGVVQLPLERRQVSESPLRRRGADDTLITSIVNAQTQYFVPLTVGTPPQEVSVVLDSGSADLWVYGSDSGARDPLYDSSKSSTYKFVSNNFTLDYLSVSVTGDWIDDTVALGNAVVKNQRLAVSHQAQASQVYGILGVAPIATEWANEKYPNFPQSLKDQGYIKRVAFSVYLNDLSASSGALLFGGIDTAKYTGKLQTIKFTPGGYETEFKVNNISTKGVLDTGTSYGSLPRDILDSIGSENGLTWSEEDQYYYSDTNPVESSVTYTFGSTDIVVPLTNHFTYDFRSGRHILAITPSSKSFDVVLLGGVFLRSAYVVFDIENSAGAIAQVKYTSDSNIVAITDAIPGASD